MARSYLYIKCTGVANVMSELKMAENTEIFSVFFIFVLVHSLASKNLLKTRHFVGCHCRIVGCMSLPDSLNTKMLRDVIFHVPFSNPDEDSVKLVHTYLFTRQPEMKGRKIYGSTLILQNFSL